MVQPVVLALVVQRPASKEIAVLSLTSEYTFSVAPKARGQRVGPTICVQSNEHLASSLAQFPVDSLTVVYGENGEGKTTLLLDVCRALDGRLKERPLGVVWRDGSGFIFLDPGSNQSALRLSGQMTSNDFARCSEPFGAVFYTTSPFESARRRQLLAGSTIDVTPSFNTNSFSGTSLCQAVGSLPKDIPFIRRVRIQLETYDRLNINEEIDSFSSAFYLDDVEAKNVRRRSEYLSKSDDELRVLASKLPARMNFLLAIELRRTRLEGRKASEALLFELQRQKNQTLDGELLLKHILESSRQRLKSQISTRHIFSSLGKMQAVVSTDAPGELLAYARALRSLSSMAIAGLQEAENIGLLRWNFLELSSGQIALLMLFASLGGALEKLRRNATRSVVLVIDEGEMFMHPAWQRKYLRDLMRFIDHYRTSFKEIHLLLATHSLIVAGDAPPNRLFDVKSGKMRNGFAYGPKEVLSDVYGVEEFSGNVAENLYEKIVEYLRSTEYIATREREIQGLIEQVASDRLRNFLLEALQQRAKR